VLSNAEGAKEAQRNAEVCFGFIRLYAVHLRSSVAKKDASNPRLAPLFLRKCNENMTIPSAYLGLEPAAVWRHFGALNLIPRPSGHEQAAVRYVQMLAQEQGASWKTDARGNICVRIPPRHASAEAPTVTLQSHLDMVCQKRPDISHDFETAPIVPRRLDDKIYATGTTLGADNGLGAAMMLAVLTSPDLVHGPLELLFTVEEETGLYGALLLDPELVRGRLLVNLDSEDPDEITIGCAGGATTNLFVPLQREAGEEFVLQKLSVSGLQGGHSGIQIGEPLANAIKLLGEMLAEAADNVPALRLIEIDGGTAHNAIPRDASALVALPARDVETLESFFESEAREIESKWRANEPGLMLRREVATSSLAPLSLVSTSQIVGLLRDLPHGVARMSERFAGKVQTSSNLAEVHTEGDEMKFSVSNRSFVAEELRQTQADVAALGRTAGARIEARDGYPSWEPSGDSPLLRAAARAFEAATGRAPKIEVVHAGLECGILSEKLPGLDAVSFGPLIRGAHTPEEWVSIPSVGDSYGVLVGLLREMALQSA
jgi:dipeptidase D